MNKSFVFTCIAIVLQMNTDSSGATSSLKSASEYRYTKPKVTNNIVGKVMGTKPSYRILRSEDISFLSEAQTEILWIEDAFPSYIPLLPMTNLDSVVLHGLRKDYFNNISVNDILDGFGHGYVSSDITFQDDSIILQDNRTKVSEVCAGDTNRYTITNNLYILKNRIPKVADITNMFENVNLIQGLKLCSNSRDSYSYGSGVTKDIDTITEYDEIGGFTNGIFITTHYPAVRTTGESTNHRFLYSEHIIGNLQKARGISYTDDETIQTDTIESKMVSHDTKELKSLDDNSYSSLFNSDGIYSADFDHIDNIEYFAIIEVSTTTNILYSIYQNGIANENRISGTDTVHVGSKIRMIVNTDNNGVMYFTPDYSDARKLVDAISNTLIPCKYGDNEIGDVIDFPTVDDIRRNPNDYRIGTFTNRKEWDIDYKIYFRGLMTLMKLKYRTTFE